jgi:hypothetical protein
MTSAVARLWERVRDWWSSDAQHVVHDYLPDGGPDLVPYRSYLRVWLAEMFLARDRRAATDRYPAVQASVRLSFGGSPDTTFSTLSRPPAGQEGPGVRRDVALTGLLPYAGGTIGLQAGLLDVAGDNDLAVALDVIGEFSSLLTPPLSTVAGIAGKVAAGIARVDDELAATGERPVLVVERTLAAGAGPLRPGHLVVIRAGRDELPAGSFAMAGGRLCRVGGGRAEPLTGYDYLVLRLEAVAERDDWRFPEWDALIGQALAAQVQGQLDRYEQLRTDLLARIVTSADLTPTDRIRVATLVRDELAAFRLGAAGEAGPDTIAGLVAARGLPDRLAVAHLTPADLLSPP